MARGRFSPVKPDGPFTLPHVARLAALPVDTLKYWAKTFIRPSAKQAQGHGNWRLYSFQDAVAIKAAAELRRAGASLQCLRRVIVYLRSHHGLEHPLAEARLVVRGKDVFLVQGNDQVISLVMKPGQRVFPFVLDFYRVVQELRSDAQRLAKAGRKVA